MNSANFREEARKRLSGKWGNVALISLAYWAFFFLLGFIGGLIPEKSLVNLLYSIATYLLIKIPLAFGLIIVFYKLYHSEDAKAFDFVQLGFDNFKRALGVVLYITLKLIIPLILLIVAICLLTFSLGGFLLSTFFASKSHINFSGFSALGIIGVILLIVSTIWLVVKSYYYQLANIVAIDNENLTSKEAVSRSEELMRDKRGKLFILQLSFIGWYLLLYLISSFTLKLLNIHSSLASFFTTILLLPYIQFATFAFYEHVNEASSNVEIITNNDISNDNHNNPIN